MLSPRWAHDVAVDVTVAVGVSGEGWYQGAGKRGRGKGGSAFISFPSKGRKDYTGLLLSINRGS